MTVDVDIVNQALGLLGGKANPIARMDENTNEAKWARVYYDETRKDLIRAAYWNFASRITRLTMLKAYPGTPENPTPAADAWIPEYPPPPWLYTYAMPANAIAFRRVFPSLAGLNSYQPFGVPLPNNVSALSDQQVPAVPFRVMADLSNTEQQIKVIATNQGTAIGEWSLDTPNVDLWDDLFRNAMIDALAARLAMVITGKMEIRKFQAQLALSSVNEARVRDGNEGLTVWDKIPDWIAAHGTQNAAPYGGYTSAYYTPAWLIG